MRSSITIAVIFCLSALVASASVAVKPAPVPAPVPSTKGPYKFQRIVPVEFQTVHDTYLATRRIGEGGSQVYTSTIPQGAWEKFWLVYLTNGKVALKTWWNTFLYLPGKGNGLLAVNSGTLGEEQLFDLINNEDGTWSLRSVAFGNFINVQPGTGDNKAESYINKGPWTRLRIHLF